MRCAVIFSLLAVAVLLDQSQASWWSRRRARKDKDRYSTGSEQWTKVTVDGETHSYYYTNKKKTYREARDFCEDKGGYVARVMTNEERLALLESAVYGDTYSCIATDNGRYYQGTKARTKNGNKCDRWSKHKSSKDMPKGDLDHRYCRSVKGKRPGCYVDGDWEYCRIQDCVDTCTGLHNNMNKKKVSQTQGDVDCMKWKKNWPHPHTNHFEDAGNYCRATSTELRPWCYTVKLFKRWDYCDVTECPYHWVGAKYDTDEKQWRWTHGKKLSKKSELWHKGEPRRDKYLTKDSHCTIMASMKDKEQFLDAQYCGNERPVLCEKD